MACAGEAVAEARATARLGDELLRHLPPDRRSSAAPISLAEAAYKITGDRLDELSRLALRSRRAGIHFF